jgi:dTDP-4-dehydrorhamnose reductase
LNADLNSPSKFYQTKAKGEEKVKAAFPNATIIRPGTLFGYEDKLLINMACKCLNHINNNILMNVFFSSLGYLVEA